MAIVIYTLLAVIGFLAFLAVTLLVVELKVVNQLMDTNKRLLIVVAGNGNPEQARVTMGALLASEKLPKKIIPGITDKKNKENEKPKNVDYQMTIGVP